MFNKAKLIAAFEAFIDALFADEGAPAAPAKEKKEKGGKRAPKKDKKKKDEEEDEETFDLDGEEEEESDDADSSDDEEEDADEEEEEQEEEEESDDEDEEASLEDVLRALQKFTKGSKSRQAEAIKLLKKYKVKSAREIPAKKYQDFLDDLEALS